MEMPDKAGIIGAVSANLYMLLIIAVFAARIAEWNAVALWSGILSSFILVPLIYLFFIAFKAKQPVIYFIWLVLMILFAIFELVADIILEVDFRGAQWSLIAYVMFFFGSTGGMIGIASRAGKRWTIVTVAIFLIMAVMAFVQRGITGI
jgi:hypothetical protein